MSKHLQREVEQLKRKLLALSAVVEESVRKAVKSVIDRDTDSAESVIHTDVEIDRMEVEVEDECLKTLALNQPVAIDLRFIIAVLKINNDLERIGDLASNIAEKVAPLSALPRIDLPFDLARMGEKTQTMLRNSLDALINLDSDLAYAVCSADDEVDAMNRQLYQIVQSRLSGSDPEHVECLLHLLAVSRHLERIADSATNVAEDVIYMIEGEIIRHRVAQFAPQAHPAGRAV